MPPHPMINIGDKNMLSPKITPTHLTALLAHLDALVVAIDMQTHTVLYINPYGRERWGNLTGQICWQTLQASQTAVMQAADLNRQLLAGTGCYPCQPADMLDLTAACRTILQGLASKLPSNIRLTTRFPAKGPCLPIHWEALSQVVTSLVLNACEALEKRSASITVQIDCQTADQIRLTDVRPSDWHPQANRYAFKPIFLPGKWYFNVIPAKAGMTKRKPFRGPKTGETDQRVLDGPDLERICHSLHICARMESISAMAIRTAGASRAGALARWSIIISMLNRVRWCSKLSY